MATLKDVAKRAGVSTATVSYVLNDKLDKVSPEVTERIREVMKELDYQPNMMARALRSRKTNIIGVLSEDVTTFQVSSVLKGINQAADEMKYQIILGDLALSDKIWNGRIQDYTQVVNYREEIREKLNIFRAAGVSGVIYVGMHNRDVSNLLNTDMPLVYAYCYTKEEGDITVDCDNQVISRELTEKMAQKGPADWPDQRAGGFRSHLPPYDGVSGSADAAGNPVRSRPDHVWQLERRKRLHGMYAAAGAGKSPHRHLLHE